MSPAASASDVAMLLKSSQLIEKWKLCFNNRLKVIKLKVYGERRMLIVINYSIWADALL